MERKSPGVKIQLVRYVFVAVVICGSIIFAWTATQPASSLLTQATAILPNETFTSNCYAWLPGEELIASRQHKLWRWNARTGARSAIEGIDVTDFGTSRLAASPDGKWLTWLRANEPDWSIHVARLSQPARPLEGLLIGRKRHPFNSPQWSSDSRYIIDRANDADKWWAVVLDLQSGEVIRAVPMSNHAGSKLGNNQNWVVLSATQLLSSEPLHTSRGGQSNSADIIEYELGNTVHEVIERNVAAPEGTIPQEVKVAPTGDCIAWIVTRENAHPWDAWLARFIPSWSEKPSWAQELWVSSIAGSNKRMIGSVRVNSNSNGISDLRWRPDGRSVSFLSQATLFTIGVR